MDVDVPSILSSAANMLQRVLPRAFSSTRSQGSSVGSQLRNVRQATSTASGPSATPAWHVLLGKAIQETGARGEYAADTLVDTGKALRNGDHAKATELLAIGVATLAPTRTVSALPIKLSSQDWHAVLGVVLRGDGERSKLAADILRDAGSALRNGDEAGSSEILAKGMDMLFPARVAAGEVIGSVNEIQASSELAYTRAHTDSAVRSDDLGAEHSPEIDPSKDYVASVERTVPRTTIAEALHAGWQVNLGRGISALIRRFEDQLRDERHNEYRDVVEDLPSGVDLDEVISEATRIAMEDIVAIHTAKKENKIGHHAEALAALKKAPSYQRAIKNVVAPFDHPKADAANRALLASRKTLEHLQAVAKSNDHPLDGVAWQQTKYAREDSQSLDTRQLVQSVAEDLYRLSAYDHVLSTLRPPVPPRLTA